MKKVLLIAMLALFALLFAGCSTASRLTVANSASISQANFHVVRPITREYTASYFIVFGGAAKKNAVELAIEDMTKELEPNQALAYINVTESSQIPIIPIIHTQTTHVSAIIIEYDR